MGWNPVSSGGASSCISNASRRRTPAVVRVSLGSLLLCKGVGEWSPHGWGGWGAATRLENEPCLLAWSSETSSLYRGVVPRRDPYLQLWDKLFNDHKLSPVQSSLQTFHPEKVKGLERTSVPLQSSLSLKTPESCICTLELGRRRMKGRKHQREVPDGQLQECISTTWLSAWWGLRQFPGQRWWTVRFSASSRSAECYVGIHSPWLQQMMTINYI